MRQKMAPIDLQFRQYVAQNIDHIVKRAETMACKLEREQVGFGSLTQVDYFAKFHLIVYD
jgi:hypothetical protein